MAGIEIAPAGDTGITFTVKRVTPVGGRPTTVKTYRGPVAAIQALEASLLAATPSLSGLASTEVTENENGRAELIANYERATLGNNVPGIEDAIQELNPVEIVRDIFSADYFKTLTNDQILEVRNLYENKIGNYEGFDSSWITTMWNALQLKLYGHLTHGQDSYFYTAYEFKQTWKTTSDRALRKSLADPNTVTDLPSLNSTMQKLVSSLPTLEWLKKPTQVNYIGRGYWAVSETWMGLPQWSVIYGGTFTGVDA